MVVGSLGYSLFQLEGEETHRQNQHQPKPPELQSQVPGHPHKKCICFFLDVHKHHQSGEPLAIEPEPVSLI